MARKYQDFSGQKVGYLTIIERIEVPKNHRQGVVYWKAICDCGQEKITTSWAIRERGKRLSCGCKRYQYGQPKNRKHKNPQDASFNAVINSYKQRCKRDNLKWLLSRTQAIAIFIMDCHYCGIEPLTEKNPYLTKQRRERDSSNEQPWQLSATIRVNGIDRIDSCGNYSINNVVPCCKICNYAKRDLVPTLFHKWLNRIRNG